MSKIKSFGFSEHQEIFDKKLLNHIFPGLAPEIKYTIPTEYVINGLIKGKKGIHYETLYPIIGSIVSSYQKLLFLMETIDEPTDITEVNGEPVEQHISKLKKNMYTEIGGAADVDLYPLIALLIFHTKWNDLPMAELTADSDIGITDLIQEANKLLRKKG